MGLAAFALLAGANFFATGAFFATAAFFVPDLFALAAFGPTFFTGFAMVPPARGAVSFVGDADVGPRRRLQPATVF
jgi:hypothetical protein